MRLTLSPLAVRDLEEIGDFIALDNPVRAVSFIAELEARCEKILRAPLIYKVRSELAEDLRSCVYGSYVIFFRVLNSEVRIERIVQGARDLPMLFDLNP